MIYGQWLLGDRRAQDDGAFARTVETLDILQIDTIAEGVKKRVRG